MKRRNLGHILGYTALTVILTAGAAQSLTGSNTVFGDDIVDGTITTPDIKANSIGGSRLLDSAVTGRKIFDGTITSSDVADNSIGGVDIRESTFVPTCPTSAPNLVGDVCYDSGTFPGALYPAPVDDCLADGLRLPSISEARLVATKEGLLIGILTDVTYDDGGVKKQTVVNRDSTIYHENQTTERSYFCVTTVGARP